MGDKRTPNAHYDYTYPAGLKLKPGTELHDKLVTLFLSKAQSSHKVMSGRYDSWRHNDHMLTSFVPLDVEEKRDKQEDPRRPIGVVIPVSYAALETLLTYQVAAFLSELPFLRYTPTEDGDEPGVMKLQAFIAFDTYKMKYPLKQHTLWRDSYVYGFGAGFCTWNRKIGFRTRTRIADDTLTSFSDSLTGNTTRTYEKYKEQTILREGNDLIPIDPYNFFPDPSVPLERIQEGEFVGFIESTTMVTLLRREQQQGYFNVRYLLNSEGALESTLNNKTYTGRYDKTDFGFDYYNDNNKPVDILHMMISLIPSVYGFGDSDYPEIWLMGIAADNTIVYLVPGGHDHGMFPLVVDVPNFDGHTVAPVSLIEMTAGLQDTYDWLIRTHYASVRKVINDILIVNPNKIYMPDLLKPGPKIVRTLQSAAFSGTLDEAVKQLQMTDVTQNHLRDASSILGLMNFILGSTPSVNSGIGRRTGERVTAEEIATDKQSSMSRLQKMAKLSAWQSIHDTAEMFAYHTQEYLDHDVLVRVLGELDAAYTELFGSRKSLNVSPLDLDVAFDVMVSDGALPWGTNPELVNGMFDKIAQNPQLLERFDVVKLFKILARSQNVNLSSIELRPSVVSDEAVQRGVEAGNLVPTGEYYGTEQ